MLSFLFSKLGAICALALICFIAGAVVCWRWTHREPKTFSDTFTVASVANGATIQTVAGLAGRKTRSVFLAGISAPGLNDPLGTQSRDNLAGLAGKTIRTESSERGIGTKPLVATCYGDTGSDLAIQQLRGGFATCESAATKDQIAAQKEAQKAGRGLWHADNGGSHWFHFSVAQQGDFPAPITEPADLEGKPMLPINLGSLLMFAAVAIVVFWILWAKVFQPMLGATTAGKAVTAIADTTEQVAAYAALTAVRYAPGIESDTAALAACDLLRNKVTAWQPAAATTATAAKA